MVIQSSEQKEVDWENIIQKEQSQYEKNIKLLQALDIPYNFFGIEIKDLCEIFNDPEKCELLICKLKNRSFI